MIFDKRTTIVIRLQLIVVFIGIAVYHLFVSMECMEVTWAKECFQQAHPYIQAIVASCIVAGTIAVTFTD